MSQSICIWCLKESHDKDLEHIFPEALGCPPHLTLSGSIVCKRCNNNLAHLDKAVVDDFDFLTVMHGIKGKKRRAAQVSSRGNVYATSTPNGPNTFFNLDPVEHITPTGERIAPYKGQPRNIKPLIHRDTKGSATVEFEVSFGEDKKFARGLYKIALNSIAYLCGPHIAASAQFDWVRSYVMHGGKHRHIMLTTAQNQEFILAAYPPWKSPEGDLAIELRIAMASFLLDLSPDETLLPKLIKEAQLQFGTAGYSVFPPLS